MKVTCLLILLIATSAVAYRNGVNPDGPGRRTRGVQGNNRALKTGGKYTGMSKAAKIMKGKGMKDKDAKDTNNEKGVMKGMGMKDKDVKDAKDTKNTKGVMEGIGTKDKDTKDTKNTKGVKGMKDTPKKDTPKKDTPKKDTPKKDTPKKDTPKKDTPKKDTPKKDTPKKDTPKKDTPKKDTPKKGKGAKGGYKSLKIKAPYSEIESGFGETAVGETLTFPVYDYYTDEPIGTYTDQTTNIFVGGALADCIFSGSFNFDFDESLDYPFASQVMVAGTCLGASNSITGGTGKYAGASGSEIFIDGGEDYFASEFSICSTCA